MLDLVDPSNYRAFCLRGEGRCNFVISAKEKQTNLRIVWRLAKHRKSGTISTKPKCQVINQYFEKIVSLFLSENYLLKVRVVNIPVDKLHHLAKIPSLPHNLKIETWEELNDPEKYPSALSFFPYSNQNNCKFVCCLIMLDATRIPRQLSFIYGPTITVEIKPKQGFYQTHPTINVPYCNNCILQIEKWRSAAFDAMYDFCPLELYSGDRTRMCLTIDSLIRDPHRNLRIFVDGNVIHDEVSVLPRTDLDDLLFPGAIKADVDTLISAIACILAGVSDDDEENEKFYLHENSILSDLLKAQKIDNIGIVRAFNYFSHLPEKVRKELMNKSNLLDRGGLALLQRSDPRSLVERYLLAATMKDCSLMISVRLVTQQTQIIEPDNQEQKFVRVKGCDGTNLLFAYSIRIVDLDPKSPKNLERAYTRFIAGVEAIKTNPNIHKPCNINGLINSS